MRAILTEYAIRKRIRREGWSKRGGDSPDRADALVWAVTDLLIDGSGAGPSVRVL